MLSILCVLVGYTTAIDECGQYYTCRDCLNITAGASTGHRDNCGWCHFPIKYRNGTGGKRCADVRDDPWTCPDLFDTYKCSAGWSCDTLTHSCYRDSDGGGRASNETCTKACQGTKIYYKCNTTTGQCDQCPKGQTADCSLDRVKECSTCESRF